VIVTGELNLWDNIKIRGQWGDFVKIYWQGCTVQNYSLSK
jgi:hypothetical protein